MFVGFECGVGGFDAGGFAWREYDVLCPDAWV